MKKSIVILLALAFPIILTAQSPEKKFYSLFTKTTASWCANCGSWGWSLANAVNILYQGKAYCLSLYVPVSGDETFKNFMLVSEASKVLALNFGFGNELPAIRVNGSLFGNTLPEVTKAIDSMNALSPQASVASLLERSGNTLELKAKVKFWAEATGEYYLASYVVEDEVINPQNPMGMVKHPHVLRASMTDGLSGTYGERIGTDNIPAGAEFDMNFSFKVTDSRWNQENLSVYSIIWKKESGRHKYVNMNKNDVVGGSSIINPEQEDFLVVSPNPMTGNSLRIQTTLPGQKTIAIYDVEGKELYRIESKEEITNIPFCAKAGVYLVHVITTKGHYVRKVLVP